MRYIQVTDGGAFRYQFSNNMKFLANLHFQKRLEAPQLGAMIIPMIVLLDKTQLMLFCDK